MRLTAIVLLATLLPLGAQDVTFRSSTQLVVQIVSVKDKSGNPIEGLTAKDFIVTEDGKPQTIAFCEFQKLAETPDTAPPVSIAAGMKPPAPAQTQISPERPGDIRYKDRRLLALYFDMSAMPTGDQLRSLAAAEKFVKTQMGAPDLMAILTYTGGSVKVVRDFTGNRDDLLTTIQTLIVGEGDGFGGASGDESAADTGAAFGQDDSEFNIFT